MDRENEIEHFGFTAEQASLERKYFLNKIIRNALDTMVNKFNAKGATLNILQKAKEDVFQNIWSSMAAEIEATDKLDKKYFMIPDHILLPAYFDHVKAYTEHDEEDLDKQLIQFKNTFLENTVMLACLKSENSQYKDLSAFIDTEVEVQELLKEAFSNINMKKVNELVHKIHNLKNTHVKDIVNKTKNLKM